MVKTRIANEPTILILASGDPRRDWTDENPCQLAPIAGQPLLLYTLAQLKSRGHDTNVTVVTHSMTIATVVPQYFYPEVHFYWAETVLSTRLIWTERTIILHGDVIFSPTVLDSILAEKASIAFHGSMGEAFGIVFTTESHARIRIALADAIEDAPKDLPMRKGRGLVWQFYRAFNGTHLHKHVHNWDIYRLAPKDDYTCDIDHSIKKHTAFLENHPWARS